MGSIWKVLSNREIATIIWLFILFVWVLSNRSVRKTFLSLLKAFFVRQILVSIILMILYISSLVALSYQIGLWNTTQIKNTIIWSLGVAFLMFFNANNVNEDENYFRNAVLDNLKLIILLEFIINLYVFNLMVELVQLPIMTLLVIMLALAESDAKYQQVKTLLNPILAIIGIGFFLFAVYRINNDFNKFLTLDNLRDFLLPPVFSVLFLPFIYLMTLYARYENLFIWLRFFIRDPDVLIYAKKRIVMAFWFNLKSLNEWSRKITEIPIKNKNDVLDSLRPFKANR